MTLPVWDKEKVKTLLPQREPFLFIDEVIETDGTNKLVAVRLLKKEESFFQGHFPGRPIMPGVLIIEAMAQAAILLYYLNKPEMAAKKPDFYLGKVKSEFLAPAFPGDKLILEATGVKIIESAGVVQTIAKVNDKIIAKAEMVVGIKTHV